MKFKRIFLIVLDSLGVGEAIDADKYNDKGVNTLGHIVDKTDLFIPNLEKMGLLNTLKMNNSSSDGYYTIARPKICSKDCISCHREMMGIEDEQYQFFNNGPLPRPLLENIAMTLQKPIIGNIVGDAIGTIQKLYKRQLETKSLIIYTTGDSNLEVACEESVFSINELYEYCEKIRNITLKNEWKLSSVVARPYRIENNQIVLSDDAKIFSLNPINKSVLELLKNAGLQTISIGKINDLFNGYGINKVIKAQNNSEATNKLLDIMEKNFNGLCYINLSDFENSYGYSHNVEGYKKALEEFDVEIPMILNKINLDDLLIITSDHGCDPTIDKVGNTRENVPVLLYSRSFIESGQLNILDTLADIGATIADNFDVTNPWMGTSFLDKLK